MRFVFFFLWLIICYNDANDELIYALIYLFSAETSISSARASVMLYDDNTKKWMPSGTSTGLSRVHIYQHIQNNTFRVVGRKLQDHEV